VSSEKGKGTLDEKGIERVVAALSDDDAVVSYSAFYNVEDDLGRKGIFALARRIVDAYLTAPPKWPTNEQMQLVRGSAGGFDQEDARDTARQVLLADPIVKAAIALRNEPREPRGWLERVQRVIDAVNEAGL
jgi:hypothetical protein